MKTWKCALSKSRFYNIVNWVRRLWPQSHFPWLVPACLCDPNPNLSKKYVWLVSGWPRNRRTQTVNFCDTCRPRQPHSDPAKNWWKVSVSDLQRTYFSRKAIFTQSDFHAKRFPRTAIFTHSDLRVWMESHWSLGEVQSITRVKIPVE
jgi:hypothetical protein